MQVVHKEIFIADVRLAFAVGGLRRDPGVGPILASCYWGGRPGNADATRVSISVTGRTSGCRPVSPPVRAAAGGR